MITQEKLQKYQDWIFRTSAYSMALNIISIDKMTVAPAAGAAYRDERTAFLAGELFSIETDPEIFAIFAEMKDDADLDGDTRRAAQLYWKSVRDTCCIPKDEFVAAQQMMNESYDAWLKAKKENDYSIFEPYLRKVIAVKRKFYEYRNSPADIYDQMLDDFEPGMNREKYDAFFASLRERLVPLIRKVCTAEQIDESFLHRRYDVRKQKEFTDHLLSYLGFDPSWGYQNETEHPFTSWTCEDDCRTTTKYIEDNIASAMLSTIHEVGHATYEHDIDPAYNGMILSEGVSSGMHESQSRLFENYLGRTEAFWTTLYPKLQEYFPEQLGGISLKQFVDAVNVSVPSLVRTEADELTYPLHIMVRYEIEKGLFDGTVSVEGLDETWNEKYREYLGISADEASKGILQDVHWTDGAFGYFPTYALGSAFSAQFMHAMRRDVDVEKELSEGNFAACVSWLKEHVHRYGCRYDADEVLQKATGESFNVNYYLDYLEEKYTKLYHL